MHFAYEGFTQDNERRRFTFRGIEERSPVSVFCLEVDLPLFIQNRVPVQDGPMFCLQLLTAASLSGSLCLERFQNYRVLPEDFRPLLIEREKRAAEKALKKPPRRPFHKPGKISNINLTSGVPER
jgi:hypothetical protein